MVVEPPLSDPLSNIRGLAQFPKSIRVPSHSNALDSIHHLIKSRGAKNPDKVLEEAKKIVDGGSELLNSDYVTFTSSMGIGEASPRKENLNPQERRPGFGRRRAKFSIKPNLSQPAVSLVTSFDMAKFPDPDEYFAEFEKHENAQKEIERQMGGCVSSSIDEDILPQNAMKKRPGILGDSRRPASYKHRYAQVISETKETIVPSPEPTELTVLKPSNSNSRQRNFDVEDEPQNNDASGSITKTEHEVNRILDELLSSNSEDLDDYGALSLLQKRLDIKPIDLNILPIPNFKDSEQIDFVALGQNLPKPQRSSFAVENFKQRTPLSDKQMGRSANSSLDSSTPRNLFGSLSSLRRRVIQPNRLGDLFSPINIDLTSPKNRPDEGSEPTETNKGLGERSIAGTLAGASPGKTPIRQSSHIDVAQNISDINFLDHDDGNDMDGKMDHLSTENAVDHNLVPAQEKENAEGAPSLPMSYIEELERTKNDSNNPLIDSHEPSQMEENVEDAPSLPMSSIEELERTKNDSNNSPIDNHEPSQMEGNVKDMPSAIFSAQVDISCKESIIPDSVEVDQWSIDEPHADAAKECTSDTVPAAPVNVSEQETKKSPSKDQEHKRRKAAAVGIIEMKNLSKRKSILDGGTTFVSGLRRSKRIKTRPLEYWKGERFLYARVNDSIKLTGFTYISPSKNDLKVKSFI